MHDLVVSSIRKGCNVEFLKTAIADKVQLHAGSGNTEENDLGFAILHILFRAHDSRDRRDEPQGKRVRIGGVAGGKQRQVEHEQGIRGRCGVAGVAPGERPAAENHNF